MNEEILDYGVPFALAAVFCLVEGLLITAVLFGGLAIRCTLQAFQGKTFPKG